MGIKNGFVLGGNPFGRAALLIAGRGRHFNDIHSEIAFEAFEVFVGALLDPGGHFGAHGNKGNFHGWTVSVLGRFSARATLEVTFILGLERFDSVAWSIAFQGHKIHECLEA